MNIAIQGELGSFHHSAAVKWYGNDITIIACETFSDVFRAVVNKQADAAICAIENSLYGSINEVYDLLLRHKIPIVGEIPERIHQCLIGIQPDIPLGSITQVHSHPVALAQCSAFLDNYLPNAERIENADTAGSVDLITQLGNKKYVAIASEFGAHRYGAKILKQNIQNHDMNYTRFLVLDSQTNIKDANKASLVIRTNHQPGALYKALGVFADAGINLTKLQSRPIPGKVWRYMFYVDISIEDQKLDAIIKHLEAQKCMVTLLGLYKASEIINA